MVQSGNAIRQWRPGSGATRRVPATLAEVLCDWVTNLRAHRVQNRTKTSEETGRRVGRKLGDGFGDVSGTDLSDESLSRAVLQEGRDAGVVENVFTTDKVAEESSALGEGETWAGG